MPPRRNKKANILRHKRAEADSLPAVVAAVATPPAVVALPTAEAVVAAVASSLAEAAALPAEVASPWIVVSPAGALRVACDVSDYGLVAELLEGGDNPDETDHITGTAALHVACIHGVIDIVTALIEAGATLDMLDEAGFTPLCYACQHGDPKVIQLLLKKSDDSFAGS
jgi:hypothetical protein